MKTLNLLLAGLALSATINNAAIASNADTPRLAFWVTEPIGATSGSQCMLPASASQPSTPPTITERDVKAWNRETGKWTLDVTGAAIGAAAQKLQDRCFVLAIDGKLINSGVVLSSHSARLTGFPTVSMIILNDALDLQLTSSNHDKSMRLLHVDMLDAVLRLKN
jgi:hypothetical protein